jgi:hypothetical protein
MRTAKTSEAENVIGADGARKFATTEAVRQHSVETSLHTTAE